MKIRINFQDLDESNLIHSPWSLLRELGIEWRASEGQPMADQIMFYGVDPDTIPAKIPSCIDIIEED